MKRHFTHGLRFYGVVLAPLVLLASCSSKYPIDVCRCSHIGKSNNYQISLVDDRNSGVTLSPAVALVERLGPEAVVLSNLKSQELIADPNSPGHRFWRIAKDAQGTSSAEGYFLHRCGVDPPLISLGMDREEAIELALKLVENANADASARQAPDEDNSTDD